jgi:2-polyprenyl-6-methoxyphenol hydroxylase-like FAD-dependent oxidoreductase
MAIETISAEARPAARSAGRGSTTKQIRTADCCIVGAGPARMILALLLARNGVKVELLEAHETFERDFRGDSVHPSTLELFDQLGLMEHLVPLQRAKGSDFPIHLPDGSILESPPRRLPTRFPHTLAVPQPAFLELLADAASAYPSFHLVMGARVEQLIEDSGVVRGVRYRARDGWHEVRASVVIGADGRFSKVRQLADISLRNTAQEIDLLWLRLPKSPTDPPRAYGLYPRGGSALVVGDRGDMWQMGLVLPKASYQQLRAAGLEALRQRVAGLAPWLADRTSQLQNWQQTSLLSIQAGLVERWYQPGLLLIGDAAHVMSPIFGVGINFAIQDAIVAANILGPRLRRGGVRPRDLAAVQRRREWPTRLMQFLQELEKYQELDIRPPLTMKIAARLAELAPMRKLRSRLIGFGGYRPELAYANR